jgi:hypothetical protein
MPSAAPRKAQGRGPLFWVLSGCCGCLTLLALGAAGFVAALYFMTQGAADAARAQLEDLKRGDQIAAYNRLSSTYQQTMTPEAFEQLVATHPALRSYANATFNNRSVSGNTASLSGTITATSGEREPVTFLLIKEGDVWKISGIEFTVG